MNIKHILVAFVIFVGCGILLTYQYGKAKERDAKLSAEIAQFEEKRKEAISHFKADLDTWDKEATDTTDGHRLKMVISLLKEEVDEHYGLLRKPK